MQLWRCSAHDDLDGVGGLYASGRWHTFGRLVVYCGLNASTALLESLVHIRGRASLLPMILRYHMIACPDDIAEERVKSKLPQDWREDISLTRAIGDEWLDSERTALLKVPCALVPRTMNIIVNPKHADSARIRKRRSVELPVDSRFLRNT
jgi:RES domain-containing protein